ncbi:MAG TPA: hypothetical protein VFI44_06140 [Ornithinibacter sp.]|nr:hypothetical protein [Ornithinibacter sp.]
MSTATATATTHGTSQGGLWREEALDRAGRIRADLLLLPQADPRVVRALGHVDEAVRLAAGRTNPAEWWSGGRVEACWRELRLAEEVVLDVGSAHEVGARVLDARTHAAYYLGTEDTRTKNLATLLERGAAFPDLVPAARIALAASHEASDREHRARRSFLNTLRATTALLAVLAASLVAAVAAWEWELLPTVADRQPVELTIIAMLFGALGALFSAIPSIAQMPSKAQTFSTVRIQAVLKVVVGAWSAVVGLMAVTASLATTGLGAATGDTQTLAGFAMVAAFFGAGQEAVTRFADHKAADLSGSSGSAGTTTT